ncbi:MAG: hypothetical protein GX321_07615 [Clostridiales bacterium]|nr:hypothetical protein [Clostridiales bacterium]
MMHRYFNQGVNNKDLCQGFVHFNSGWNFIIGVGLIITIALLIYIFVNNKKKEATSEAFEVLKLQFVKGEISEEEFYRRKSLLDR